VAAGVAAGVTLLVSGVLVGFAHQAAASSHREAPLISKDPYADNTDTYAFLSPADQNRLVLLGSWIPFEGPEGGPNYYEWDDSALYDIYVDNNGDATADYTYTLSSQVQVGNPDTFLYNTGPIGSVGDTDWNRKQFYTVTETAADGTVTVLVATSPPPLPTSARSRPRTMRRWKVRHSTTHPAASRCLPDRPTIRSL